MPNKKITIDALNPADWEKFAIEVETYQDWLSDRCSQFVNRLAEEGVRIAQINFNSAVYAGINDVECMVTGAGGKGDEFSATITANGESVIFIEFGSGIAFANAYQFEYGFAPGSYGLGQGLNSKGWLYAGPPGDNPPFGTEPSTKKSGMTHTYGNPANAAMLEAVNALERKIGSIAAEVFA